MENALAVGVGVNYARSCKEQETKAVARIAMIADRPTKPIFIVLLLCEFNPQGQVSISGDFDPAIG
jgi:hypothetical protein